MQLISNNVKLLVILINKEDVVLVAIISLYLLLCTIVIFFGHMFYRKYIEKKMYEAIYMAGIFGFFCGVLSVLMFGMLIFVVMSGV